MSFLKLKQENYKLSAVLMAFISVVTFGVIVLIGKLDRETAAIPTYDRLDWNLHASWAFVFDAVFNWYTAIAGLIIAIVMPIYYVFKNAGLGAGEGDKTPGHIYAISWMILLVGCLWPMHKYQNSEYTEVVPNAVYEKYKNNVDSFFIDHPDTPVK